MLLSTSNFAQISIINKGIGGNNTNDLLKRIDADVLSQSPDLVIMMVGTNDMLNTKKIISYDLYRSNYESIVQKLIDNKIKVVLMSSPPVDTGYLFQRHRRELFQQQPNEKIDSIRTIVKQIAKNNGLCFLDLNEAFKVIGSPNRTKESLIINEANKAIPDGIHPTKEGYQFISKKIYRFLKKHRLIKKNMKIICFGDSITYGSFMKGEGTTSGDTYPAMLQNYLNKK